MRTEFTKGILFGILGMIFISLSCKEYEFTSPYDKQNNVSAPAGLQTAFIADTAVSLKWQYSFEQGINYTFDIELSEDGQNYSLLKIIKENIDSAVVEHPFTAEKMYYFRVRSRADNNASAYVASSAKISFPAPSNLQVNFEADTAVVLNWTKTSALALIHVIEQSVDEGSYSEIGTAGVDQTVFRYYSAFLVGHNYKYRVKALSRNSISPYSSEVIKSITFDAPGNVTAILPTDTVAIIQWTDNSTIETGYEVYLSTDGGPASFIQELSANSTQTDYVSDYFAGHTYIFSVRAKSARKGVTSFASTSTQFNLMQVTDLTVTILDSTRAYLSWKNGNGYAREIVIEQSLDGTNYVFVKNVWPSLTSETINGYYSSNDIYYYRIRTNSKNHAGKYVTKNTFNCGTSKVSHYERIYNTVQVGSQCWLKENLNTGTMILGTATPTNNGIIEKYCYGNDEGNCNALGGLYSWYEAIGYSAIVGAKGICPEGWHIPTEAEFQTLSAAVVNNSNALKAIGQGADHGSGTNISGFSAILAGDRNQYGSFGSYFNSAHFWSSTEYSFTDASYIRLLSSDSNIYYLNIDKEFGFSIRCIKD